jgi:MFS family permease
MDLSNRRWGIGALLALLAAVLLTLAAFLPLFTTEVGVGPQDVSGIQRGSVNSWGGSTSFGSGLASHRDTKCSTGYQQLIGAALALTGGLLAAIAARKTPRGGRGSLVLLIAAGAFNIGVASILGTVLLGYFMQFPTTHAPDIWLDSHVGLGSWLMVAGTLSALAAPVVVLLRKREPAPVAQVEG